MFKLCGVNSGYIIWASLQLEPAGWHRISQGL
jgi:hypothetical protein